MRLLVPAGTLPRSRARRVRLARGHELTSSTAGQTNARLSAKTEKIRGDRTLDLSPLTGREWDAVLDVAHFLPRVVRRSIEALAGRVGCYVYVSSVSAYANHSTPPVEGAPVAGSSTTASEDLEQLRRAEGGVRADRRGAFGERALVVRPGLSRLDGNSADRSARTGRDARRQGGRVLAPCPPDQPVQFNFDVRDLADWIVSATEAQARRHLQRDRRHDLVRAAARRVPASRAKRRSSGCRPSSSSTAGVGEWMELPLWIATPAYSAMQTDRKTRHEGEARWAPVQAAGRDDRGHARVGREREILAQGRRLTPDAGAELLAAGLSGLLRHAADDEARREAGSGIVVFFTTSSEELRDASPCSSGRWASGRPLDRLAKEGRQDRQRPDFETVQQIGLEEARRQQERRRGRGLAGRTLRVPAASATAS